MFYPFNIHQPQRQWLDFVCHYVLWHDVHQGRYPSAGDVKDISIEKDSKES